MLQGRTCYGISDSMSPNIWWELCRYWCVKEAFVKAIGTGVGYKLDCIEFHHNGWTNIRVKVDEKEMKDWKFWLFNMGRNHSVSISLLLSLYYMEHEL